MFPVYKDVNLHPHQRNQTPYPQFFNPTWEAFRPQRKEDQANAPTMHEYWPHDYGYPAPTPCQNCCSHGPHPSNHYFRPPPYPHFPPPPPYGHYYGGYPYPAAYPQPYPYVPPPYYPMEMPRYEYDEGPSKAFHCCECPNHPPHVKSTSNVKIEEHEPDGEMKKAESLVPAGVSKSPYPILWVPPGYMLNKERPMQEVESDADEQRVSPYVEKPLMQSRPHQSEVKPKQGIQPVEQDPNVKYQWFPLDMNSIKRMLEGEDVMKPHDQEKTGGDKKAVDTGKNDQNKQLSYPIIWMPYGGQKADNITGQGERNTGKAPAEEQEVRNKAKRPVEEHPPVIRVGKHPDKEVVLDRTPAGDHASGDGNRGSHKTGNVKIIPVKQLDDHAPKSLKEEQKKDANVCLKNVGENMSRESAKNGTDVRPSSPIKKSKLPPICLRVDPPRKKNGKGSSRSPSPPGEKKAQVSGDSKEERKDKAKEEVQVKEEVGKDSCGNDVVISHSTEEEEKRSCVQEHQSEAEGKMVQDADDSKRDGTKCGDDGMNATSSQEMKERKHEEDGAQLKKVMSETEAAVIFQSAYRGFAVRRWEPLKKLRQIANVSEEASKIRRQIEKLESCPCVTLDNKEKIAIGEHIMNLLLKLDTIQGLHPSVRDVRRSVAKKLITLQEKLDSIVSQKSIPSDLDISNTEVVQEHPTISSSEIDSAETSVVTRDASEVSEQGETPEEDKGEQAQNEGEGACFTMDPLSQSLASKDVVEEVHGVNEEPGREPNKEELVQPIETTSDDVMPESGLEMKETELEKPINSSEDFSTELQDSQTESMHLRDTLDQLDIGSCNRAEEEYLLATSSQHLVEEQVEDDICRMDWECDLGAAKVNLDIEQTTQLDETPQEIEKQDVNTSAPSEKFAVVEKVEEEHLHPESRGDVIKEMQDEIPQEIQKQDVNTPVPSEKCFIAEKVEEEHVHPESQGEVIKEKEGDPCEVENPTQNTEQVEDQPDDKHEVQCDDSVAIEHEHILVETSHEENPSGQASEMGMDVSILSSQEPDTVTDEPVLELEAAAEKGTSVKPVTEVDEVLGLENSRAEPTQCEDVVSDEQVEEATNGSSSSPRTVSGDLIDAELPETDKEEGDDSVQVERRIVEENKKLRDMVEKLLASGKQQQDVITGLTAKVKDLEKKLPKRNKMKSAKHPRPRVIVSRRKSPMVH